MIQIRRPNRFKIVTDMEEVSEHGGLYYFNPGLTVSAYDSAQGDIFLKAKARIRELIEDRGADAFASDLYLLVEGLTSVTPYLLSRGAAFELYDLGVNPILPAGNALYALGHKARIGAALADVLTLPDKRDFLYIPELVFLMSLTDAALFNPSKVELMIQWFVSSPYVEAVDVKLGLSKWQLRRVVYKPARNSGEVSISFFDMKRILEMNELLRDLFADGNNSS